MCRPLYAVFPLCPGKFYLEKRSGYCPETFWPHWSMLGLPIQAHKCAEVAALQLRLLGAEGVCCQKLAEVEALAAGGVPDILLSNEVVAPRKLQRLAEVMRETGCKVSLCVDDKGALERAGEVRTAAPLFVTCNTYC